MAGVVALPVAAGVAVRPAAAGVEALRAGVLVALVVVVLVVVVPVAVGNRILFLLPYIVLQVIMNDCL